MKSDPSTTLTYLSLLVMMVSDEVPATSEVIPLIGKYYIGLIFIVSLFTNPIASTKDSFLEIFIAAFTTTLTLAFQMRGNAGMRMSPWMKSILFEKLAK